ncbi:Transmembrane emp24 domain-containing protein 6, partial [Intoshia linei]
MIRSLYFLFFIGFIYAKDYHFSLMVEPQKQECVYETIERDGVLFNIDYQIISGNDYSVTFTMTDMVRSEYIEHSEGTNELSISHTVNSGLCRLCWINNGVRGITEQIYVDLHTDEEQEKYDDIYSSIASLISLDIKALKEVINQIVAHFHHMERYQHYMDSMSLRDTFILRKNFTRVNFWSAIQIIFMLCSAIFQIMFIRYLFGESPMKNKT